MGRRGLGSEGALAALPPSARGHRVRFLALPALGRLEVADTVHVASVGGRTVGVLAAHDAARTLWLLLLRLRPAEGSGRWQATVGRVVSAGATHSFPEDGPAPAFTFGARGSGATRTIEELECPSASEPSSLRLAPALDPEDRRLTGWTLPERWAELGGCR